jgi:hypothetical protein
MSLKERWIDHGPAVAADDRNEAGGDDPGRPGTLRCLVAIWRDRDVMYAQRTRALLPDQVEAIREYRKKEVCELCPTERARAWAIAHTWFPPQHGQGTGADAPDGLRSWL